MDSYTWVPFDHLKQGTKRSVIVAFCKPSCQISLGNRQALGGTVATTMVFLESFTTWVATKNMCFSQQISFIICLDELYQHSDSFTLVPLQFIFRNSSTDPHLNPCLPHLCDIRRTHPLTSGTGPQSWRTFSRPHGKSCKTIHWVEKRVAKSLRAPTHLSGKSPRQGGKPWHENCSRRRRKVRSCM